jgi:hypothetical protein
VIEAYFLLISQTACLRAFGLKDLEVTIPTAVRRFG